MDKVCTTQVFAAQRFTALRYTLTVYTLYKLCCIGILGMYNTRVAEATGNGTA